MIYLQDLIMLMGSDRLEWSFNMQALLNNNVNNDSKMLAEAYEEVNKPGRYDWKDIKASNFDGSIDELIQVLLKIKEEGYKTITFIRDEDEPYFSFRI